MNIHFACSITGGRDHEAYSKRIIGAFLEDGHQVLPAPLADSEEMALEAVIDPHNVHKRDMTWIRGCDALLAEVSTASHGAGYEVAFALSTGKPVLSIFQEGQLLSKMITGHSDPNLRVNDNDATGEAISIIRCFFGNNQTDCE